MRGFSSLFIRPGRAVSVCSPHFVNYLPYCIGFGFSNHAGSALDRIGHDAGEEHGAGVLLDDRAEKRMVDDHLERRRTPNKCRYDADAGGRRSFSAFLIHLYILKLYRLTVVNRW
jgi:hypothetical protein